MGDRVLHILKKKRITQDDKREALRLIQHLISDRDRWKQLYGEALKVRRR
jgi:hypothetical protein